MTSERYLELFENLVETSEVWDTVIKFLVGDTVVTVWLIIRGLIEPSTAEVQIIYHASMDALLMFTLFASYFDLVRDLKEAGLDHELEEPPLSYVPYLISTVPPGLFMFHFFLVFGGKPLDEWLNWLIVYGVAMLIIVAITYILFYRLERE
jgi:hypothetical protein